MQIADSHLFQGGRQIGYLMWTAALKKYSRKYQKSFATIWDE